MANKTIDMHKIRQIFRLFTHGKSKLSISEQTGVARNTVKKYIRQFIGQRLTYDAISALSDHELEERFSTGLHMIPSDKCEQLQKLLPGVDKELKLPGVTRYNQWEEYRKEHPQGYGKTQFCYYYNQWLMKTSPVMHMVHKAGDKIYVDFAGEKLHIVDTTTGEIKEVEVFVAILGASQLTYVEATPSQKKEDFIIACENALHYIWGVPAAIVTDNLKSAVIKSSKYEPTLNETFSDFAEHYQTSILPTRAYKPRDKALVEGAVKIMYTRIHATLRNQTFFSIEELNKAIWLELERHNNQPLKGRNYSRRQQFDEVEKPMLLPLPEHRYEFKKQQVSTVMKNGHICLGADKHYYSVPYKYVGKKVKVIYSRSQVDIFYHYECIAAHNRIMSPYNYTTLQDHLASAHQFISDWTPEKFITRADSVDADVKRFIICILDKKQHPEQAYKSCAGVLSFEVKVGRQRLIHACRQALDYGIYNYSIIKNILDKGLDKCNADALCDSVESIPQHENIRGEEYYQ